MFIYLFYICIKFKLLQIVDVCISTNIILIDINTFQEEIFYTKILSFNLITPILIVTEIIIKIITTVRIF